MKKTTFFILFLLFSCVLFAQKLSHRDSIHWSKTPDCMSLIIENETFKGIVLDVNKGNEMNHFNVLIPKIFDVIYCDSCFFIPDTEVVFLFEEQMTKYFSSYIEDKSAYELPCFFRQYIGYKNKSDGSKYLLVVFDSSYSETEDKNTYIHIQSRVLSGFLTSMNLCSLISVKYDILNNKISSHKCQ